MSDWMYLFRVNLAHLREMILTSSGWVAGSPRTRTAAVLASVYESGNIKRYKRSAAQLWPLA